MEDNKNTKDNQSSQQMTLDGQSVTATQLSEARQNLAGNQIISESQSNKGEYHTLTRMTD